MQASRRVVFNPTSIPCLRAPRPRQEFYHNARIARIGGSVTSLRWNGVRRLTTQAGEDKSGHINAAPNEAILFIDSMYKPFQLY